jgi:1-acyl-sn-glycerol-3-phosphate acyltransferase
MGLRYSFKFVSKASLFRVPFAGWMMRRMKYVAIERGRLPSTQQMMETSEALLRAGVPVLIFPEGTYASGASRLRFKRGAFKLAQVCNVPIVPVVVKGTSELVFEDGPWFSASSDVRVVVMPPRPPPGRDERDEDVAKEMEANYANWLGQSFPHSP